MNRHRHLLPTVTALAIVALTAAPPAAAQDPPPRHGLWVALGLGGGQVEHWSDQQAATSRTTVTMTLRGGLTVARALRLGMEANGWGLETSSYNDPAKGVTVNELLLIAQLYPWPAKGWYLKGGLGWGKYHSHHPNDWGSHAFGATVLGAGYDLRLARNLSVTLAADWARGPLGSVDNLVTTSTGRRFRAWDLSLGVQYH